MIVINLFGLGYSTGITTVTDLLAHGEIAEIQLFSKSTHQQNRAKVEDFSKNLQRHFETREPKPAINIQVAEDRAAYGAAVCYKAADGRPVVLVGTSLEHNGMAETLAECHNPADTVRPYRLEPVANQYPLVAVAPPPPEPGAAIEMQLKMREAMRGMHDERKAREGAEAAEAAELHTPPPPKECCPIL